MLSRNDYIGTTTSPAAKSRMTGIEVKLRKVCASWGYGRLGGRLNATHAFRRGYQIEDGGGTPRN